MIPQVMNNPDAGIEALKNAGVDKNFINSMFGKYGKYAGKLGMSQNSLKSMIDKIGNSVGSNDLPDSNQRKRKPSNGFNSGKYPKL